LAHVRGFIYYLSLRFAFLDSTVFEQAATSSNGNVGVLSVRFYRPWATQQFLASLPNTVKNIVVLENSDQARYCSHPSIL
jgi:pyruvate/2-oxoacid:ferredoxin oxidoreductase alpha subunit